MKKIVIYSTLGILVTHDISLAETMKLSAMKPEDEVAIQRGYSVSESSCIFSIIKEIASYGGPAAMQEFIIRFDDEPLQIANGQITHTCNNGTHTWIENGEKTIVQQYDAEGNPTMEEP